MVKGDVFYWIFRKFLFTSEIIFEVFEGLELNCYISILEDMINVIMFVRCGKIDYL